MSPSFSKSAMAVAVGDQFLQGTTGRNTRGMLRVIILCTIAAAAVSSRLFSVIRFESIIHECKCCYECALGQQQADLYL